MDGLLILLIIIFFATQKKKKKNARQNGREKSDAARRMAPIDKAIKSGFGEMKEFMEDVGSVIDEVSSDDDDEYIAPAKLKAKKLTAKAAKAADGMNVQMKMNIPSAKQSIPEGVGMPGAASMQGKSLPDEQGCLGGSLPHTQHEGEARDEHGEHMRRIRAVESEVVLADDIARELQAMNVRKLRRAIVVSEILDKPKALRRR